jgi:hypothetical protein
MANSMTTWHPHQIGHRNMGTSIDHLGTSINHLGTSINRLGTRMVLGVVGQFYAARRRERAARLDEVRAERRDADLRRMFREGIYPR